MRCCKKKYLHIATVFVVLTLLTACTLQSGDSANDSASGKAPIALKVGEGFVNPIGYYESMPRFSWQVSPTAAYQFQQAF
ncbi:MAG: hypothetical protein P8Q24_09810 [Glaciecola sp.]|nr:hypothetical protein [Glaciecola sp.]